MELTPQKLCKAFEEAQREEFCPTAGVLWKSVQRNRDAVRDERSTGSGATQRFMEAEFHRPASGRDGFIPSGTWRCAG
jgi:hypothetical protein